MALYRVRNNTRSALVLRTRAGFRRLGSGQTSTLDLVSIGTQKMRFRYQSGQISVLPMQDPRTGRLSPALPRLGLGAGRGLPPVPPETTTPGGPSGGVLDFSDPANSGHIPGI